MLVQEPLQRVAALEPASPGNQGALYAPPGFPVGRVNDSTIARFGPFSGPGVVGVGPLQNLSDREYRAVYAAGRSGLLAQEFDERRSAGQSVERRDALPNRALSK